VFGGVAHLDREPTTPKAELLMAVVGPLTSIGIGIAASVVGMALAAPSTELASNPEIAARAMSPIATILLWLGPINVILGVFNLVPGFPLDGGRVLRALVWWSTNDIEKATRWASACGRGFGFFLIATGLLMAFGFRAPFFGTGLGGGLWLVLIGWFLHNAARASYEQLVVRRRLEGVPVTEVMRSRIYTVTPELAIADFVRDFVMDTDQTTFPVVRRDDLVGVISTRAVREIPRDEWPFRTVADAMTTADPALTIDIGRGANEALEMLAASDADQLPVVDHGQLRGVVRRNDILKWLTLQPNAIA
jgi:Zn-dependent protease/predicted transcriptional regulator